MYRGKDLDVRVDVGDFVASLGPGSLAGGPSPTESTSGMVMRWIDARSGASGEAESSMGGWLGRWLHGRCRLYVYPNEERPMGPHPWADAAAGGDHQAVNLLVVAHRL